MLDLGLDLLSQVISNDLIHVTHPPERLAILSSVSRSFAAAVDNPLLWRGLIHQCWKRGLIHPVHATPDYKQLYQTLEQHALAKVEEWHHNFQEYQAQPERWIFPMQEFLIQIQPELADEDPVENLTAHEQLQDLALEHTKIREGKSVAAAEFLWRVSMDRTMRGEFLGRCKGLGLPMAVIGQMPLEGVSIVKGLQMLLQKFGTRTSSALNRLIRVLGAKLHEAQPDSASPDVLHSLIYAAMLLNTDMYCEHIKDSHRITREQFTNRLKSMISEQEFEPITGLIDQIYDEVAEHGPLCLSPTGPHPSTSAKAVSQAVSRQETNVMNIPGMKFFGMAEGCVIC